MIFERNPLKNRPSTSHQLSGVHVLFRAKSHQYHCDMEHQINLFKAVAEMRADTLNHQTFTIEFISYSRTKKDWKAEKKIIPRALVRKSMDRRESHLPDVILELWDADLKQNRHCYIPAIVGYNGLKVKA